MGTNRVADNLKELKISLQELESAVQRPSDCRGIVEDVNGHFPRVFSIVLDTIQTLLHQHGDRSETPREVIESAHGRGWLRGDLPLWLHMVNDYECIEGDACQGDAAVAVCQDVRACTCILWQTYELLLAKFRSQTQVKARA